MPQGHSTRLASELPIVVAAGNDPGDVGDAHAAVLRHGAVLRFRRRQKIALAAEDGPMHYVVARGALLVDLEIMDGRRQILLLLLPGDIVATRLLPQSAACRLMATGPTELVRLKADGLAALASEEPDVAAALGERSTRVLARAVLHAASIGRLGGEERLASYLLELGARSGALSAQAPAIDMPLTRADIADYLALNADTLSRIMSRLRARGAIGRATRGRLIVRSWPALRALSPIADLIAPAEFL